MEKRHIRALLLTISIEGLWALIVFFQMPSMERNSVLWGYSAVRLLLGGSFFLVLVVILTETVITLLNQDALREFIVKAENLLLKRYFLLPSGLLLLCGALVGIAYTLLSTTSLIKRLPILVIIYDRVSPLILWAIAVFVQSLVILLFSYNQEFRNQEFMRFSWRVLIKIFQKKTVWMPLVLTILCVIVMFPYLPKYVEVPGHDSGIFLYFGSQILKGKLPYRDLWDHKPPIIFFIDALGLLLGHGSRMGLWALELIALLSTALFAFYFLRKYFGNWPAIIAAASSIVNLSFLLEGGNLTEEFALPLQFFALFLFASCKKVNRPWKGFAIGVAAGIAFLLKQTMIGVWIAICIVILFEKAEKHDRSSSALQVLLISIGAVSICFAVGMFFAFQNSLYDFWDVAFRYNFIYSEAGITQRLLAFKEILLRLVSLSPYFLLGMCSWVAVVGFLIFYKRLDVKEYQWKWFRFAIMLISIGLVLGSAGAIFAQANKKLVVFCLGLSLGIILILMISIKQKTESGKKEGQFSFSTQIAAKDISLWPLWIAVLDVPIEILLISTSTKNYYHYFLVLIPSFSILIAFLVSVIPRFQRKYLTAAYFLILTISLCLPAINLIIHQMKPQTAYQVSGTVNYILEKTEPTDCVLVWGSQTVVNYLSDRVSPTRFVHQKPLFRAGYASGSLSAEFLSDLKTTPPKLIINTWLPSTPFVDIRSNGECKPPETNYPESMEAVFNYICDNYRLVKVLGKDQWEILEYITQNE